MSQQKNAYVEQLKTQLNEWNVELERMETQVREAQADMRGEYEKQLERLRRDRDTYMTRLEEVMAASEGAWGDLRTAMEQSWEDMRRAMVKAHTRFKE
jgi:TolA-binding protein